MATAVLVIVGAALGVLVPKLASAESAAVCHATNGTSSYEFDGELAVAAGSRSRVAAYGGEFYGVDSDRPDAIPVDAKNDFQIDILRFEGNTTVYGEHTPDTIDYGTPYAAEPYRWYLAPGEIYFARFTAAFDKRDVGDAHCTADSTTFLTPVEPGVEPQPPGEVCEQVNCNILDS